MYNEYVLWKLQSSFERAGELEGAESTLWC